MMLWLLNSEDQYVAHESCNIGEGGIVLAEAVHGSAPDIAGKLLESRENGPTLMDSRLLPKR
ncbi:hypothetical protein LguiB_015750 [Lonicera macranthoides]